MTTYRSDLQRAWDRINSVAAGRLQTSFGTIQYAETGEGLPLLVSHGVLGCHVDGVDGWWSTLWGSGFRIIAPGSATSTPRCHLTPRRPIRPTPTPCCSTTWKWNARWWPTSRPAAARSWSSGCATPIAPSR